MNTKATNTERVSKGDRYIVVALLIMLAFFASYRYAQAKSQATLTPAGAAGTSVAAAAGGCGMSGGSGSGGGGCCGGGSSTPVEGSAVVEGDVQRISVDVTNGYNPNVIKLKAGVPAEITFGPSSGCTAQVISPDLGFSEDLTTGPKTVRIEPLAAGTYNFSCGMQMVTGTIVVE